MSLHAVFHRSTSNGLLNFSRYFIISSLLAVPISCFATVTSQTTSVTYTCTGAGPYAFTFSASAPAALTVTENGVVLSSTAYTVTAVNNNLDNGGSVTLNTACASGTLVLTRVTPLTQTSVFTDNMPIPMKTFENGLDKLTEIDQELNFDLSNLSTSDLTDWTNANLANGLVPTWNASTGKWTPGPNAAATNPFSPSSFIGPIFNAATYGSGDWGVHTASALAAASSTGGTVYVPGTLAGSTSTSLTVPAGVSLWLDCSLTPFATSGTITFTGGGGKIQGCAPTATTLEFTGATDGLVIAQNATIEKDLIVENFTIETSNPSGGKAFSFSNGAPPNNNPAVEVTMRKVNITTTGSGAWAYGIFLQAMVGGAFYDTNVDGAVNVAIHGDCAAGEISFINDFVSNNGSRGYEFLPGVGPPNCGGGGDDVNIIGGGIQGNYTGSGLFAQGYTVYLSGGLHYDSVGAFGDGDETVIADGGGQGGGLIDNGIDMSSLLVTYTSIPSTIFLNGVNMGTITTAAQTQGAIFGVNYQSMTLNNADISLNGNKTHSAVDHRFQIGSLFSISPNYAAGTTTFAQQGITVQTFVNGATSEITLPASFCHAWGTPGSEDSWLCRLGANSLGIGSSQGGSNGTLKVGTVQQGGVGVPTIGAPTVNQAACIKAAGPPVVIGYCSTVVGAGGACTCN